MAAKVLIDFEANLGNLEAAISKIEQGSDQLSESAAQAGKKVSEEYRKVASSAKAAFASQEVNNALKSQVDNVDKLADELKRLYDEEVRLLTQNKQNTAEFTKNAKAIEAARKQFDGLKSGVQTLNKELPKTAKEIAELEDELKALAIAGKQNTKEFDDIARAIGEYKAAITTADRAVDLYAKSTDAATGRLGELEDKLYDLALAGQTNTQEFKDTIAEVTKLKRAVFEVDQQVDSYVERSRGFATVVQNVELVGNAFQVVEGVTAAFGVESEELQETLVRLNAIIAVTNGLQQVRTILLEQDAKKTGIAAVAQRAYALAVGTSTGAMKAFRLALAGTGIGILVVALGELVSAFLSLRNRTEEQIELNKKLQQSNNELEKSTLSASLRLGKARIDQLVLEGKLTEAFAKRNNLQIEANDEIRKINEEADKKNQERVDLFNQSTFKSYEDQAKAKKQLTKDLIAIEKERANLEQAINIELNNAIKRLDKDKEKDKVKPVEEQVKAYEQLAIEVSDVTAKLIESDKNIRDATTNALISSREAELSRLRVLFEEGLATRQQVAEAETKLVLANQRAQIEGIEQSLKDSLVGVKEGTLEEKKLREAATQDILNVEQQSAEQIFNINKALNEALSEADKKQIEERKQRNEELIKDITQFVGAVQQSFNAIADIQRDATEQRIEQIERLRDIELEANNTAEKSFADRKRNEEAINLRASRKITEEKRKQARLDKALGIFNATIDTAKAVVGFLSDPGGVAGVILSVAAGITGATQVAKISSEPLPSFGKGGWIEGEPHSRGGVNINAEGDEFVVRKSEARKNRMELEAMNTSRAAFLKLIQERHVKPALMAATLERGRDGVNVNVNAKLNGNGIESRLDELRRETRKNGKIMQKVLTGATSSRYSW